jgi:hypothetical protein
LCGLRSALPHSLQRADALPLLCRQHGPLQRQVRRQGQDIAQWERK